jgi:hypothetical protein
MLNQGPSTKRQCRAVSIRPPSRSQPDRSRDRALIPLPLHQVLSAVTSTRVYISEQFPTALRGRGHIFGESTVRLFAGVLAPFFGGTAYRLADDIVRYDFPGCGDRRLYPAGLWPRDRSGAGVTPAAGRFRNNR